MNDDTIALTVTQPTIGEPKVDANAYAHWKERTYARADKYDGDLNFFENTLKSAHIEGKMSAREMSFAGSAYPVVQKPTS